MRAYYPFTLQEQTYHAVAVPAEGEANAIRITLERDGVPVGRLKLLAVSGQHEPAALIGLACAQMHARGLDAEALAAGGEEQIHALE